VYPERSQAALLGAAQEQSIRVGPAVDPRDVHLLLPVPAPLVELRLARWPWPSCCPPWSARARSRLGPV